MLGMSGMERKADAPLPSFIYVLSVFSKGAVSKIIAEFGFVFLIDIIRSPLSISAAYLL